MQEYHAPSAEVDRRPLSPQRFIAITLAAQLLWLSHTFLRVWQTALEVEKRFAEFGGTLPAITASFLALYPYAPLVLLPLAALSVDVARRRRVSQNYAMALFGGITLSIWAWHGWFTLAMYLPMKKIADAIR